MSETIRSVEEARRTCNFPATGTEYRGEASSGDDPDSRKGYWVGERPRLVRWAGESFNGSFDPRSPYSWWAVWSRPDGSELQYQRNALTGGVPRHTPTAAELVRLFGPVVVPAR